MKVRIEFYRIRKQDDAHATLGRVNCDALNAEAAVAIARVLVHTLDMPQVPDFLRVLDDRGSELFCGAVAPLH